MSVRILTRVRLRSIMVDRNCNAAEPPSAPAPCRSGVRGRSAPAAGGYLRAERPAHKPNRRFGRGARTVCCANAQKDRAPEGARFPQSATLTTRILTRVRGSGQSWLAGIARRRSRRRHRHPAGLGSGGEAPRPPEVTCGRNDRLTNRIEDSDGEPARSVARMRSKTAPRKGRASPSLQH